MIYILADFLDEVHHHHHHHHHHRHHHQLGGRRAATTWQTCTSKATSTQAPRA